MILIPIFALIVGVIVGLFFARPVDGVIGTYLAIAAMAGLDSVFGGLRSAQEGKFHTDVFVSGFVTNIALAAFMAWLGDQIGVNLFLVAALVIGARIFRNVSLMRRYALSSWADARRRRALERQMDTVERP